MPPCLGMLGRSAEPQGGPLEGLGLGTVRNGPPQPRTDTGLETVFPLAVTDGTANIAYVPGEKFMGALLPPQPAGCKQMCKLLGVLGVLASPAAMLAQHCPRGQPEICIFM